MEDYTPSLGAEGARACSMIRDDTYRMNQLIDDLLIRDTPRGKRMTWFKE